MKRLLAPLLVALAGCTSISSPQTKSAGVTITNLRESPQGYHGKPIRTEGVWVQDYESSILILRSVGEGDSIHVSTDLEAAQADPKFMEFERMRRASAKAQLDAFDPNDPNRTWTFLAKVELEGVFEVAESPVPFGGFGHMGQSPFQIRLQRLLSYEVK